jgi:N-acyl-D-amino-acid deacylase
MIRMSDILIRRGLIADGTGGPLFEADILVEGASIRRVGKLDTAGAKNIIDAGGHVVAPGFIDMHCHADFSLPVLPTADSLVHQGITTAVIGQCGLSPAPLPDKTRDEVITGLSGILSELEEEIPWQEWSSFGDYLSFLTRLGISINVASLVGQGTIRASVMGFKAGRSTPEQMALMQREAVRSLREGAFGLSTGLIYPPGSYASTDELIELTSVVAGEGGLYFSHIRGESETLLDAVAEAVQIGRDTRAPVEVSHFKAAGRENWGKSREALDLIEEARKTGVDIATDMYPYTAGSTMVVTVLPEWAQEGGKEVILRRLSDPSACLKMTRDMKEQGFARSIEWDRVLITGSPKHPGYRGRFVSELAHEAGQTAQEWVFAALLETELQLHMAIFAMSEDNRRQEVRYPPMTFCTDGMGFSAKGKSDRSLTHPRSYGAFPRVLSHYVREEGLLSLEEAVHKMTGMAAKRLGLKDRGLIRPGFAADLVIFDPDKVKDKASYENPHQYAEGIMEVLVNGESVVHDGTHTGSKSGLVLSRT